MLCNKNNGLDPLPLSKTEAGGKVSYGETPPVTHIGSPVFAGNVFMGVSCDA